MPKSYLAIFENKKDPFTIKNDQVPMIKTITVGSSNAAYLQPWTGKIPSEVGKSQISKIIKRGTSAKIKDMKQREAEKEFFKLQAGTYKEFRIRPNYKTWVNPSIPYLTSTPDGLVLSGLKEVVAVIELKSTSCLTIQDLEFDCRTSRKHGVYVHTDVQTNEPSIKLRPGHQWFTQLSVQMIVHRVSWAILGLRVADSWFTTTVYGEEGRHRQLVLNTIKSYSRLLNKVSESNWIESAVMTRKRGRPKKKTNIRRTDYFLDKNRPMVLTMPMKDAEGK